jgi:ATP-dependent DNA helicase RecG
MQPTDLISTHFRLAPTQVKALKKLGLQTVHDLLYHFPARYDTETEVKRISDISAGETVTLYGRMHGLKTRKAWVRKIPMGEGTLTDDSGSIGIVWFNQPYIAKMIHEGAAVEVRGKVSQKKSKSSDTGTDTAAQKTPGVLYLSNPEIKPVGGAGSSAASIASSQVKIASNSLFGEESKNFGLPVYPESRGITSRWFHYTMQKIFASGILQKIPDPIPEHILKHYSLPSLASALVWVHAPQNEADSISARKRFAFEEIFIIQLQKQKERLESEARPAFQIFKTEDEMQKFIGRFPFSPTEAQTKAINDVLTDMRSGHAMSRLLEGDVGSGKTAVAAATMFAVTTTRPPVRKAGEKTGSTQTFGALQTAYMAPTEILATQHFESFIQYFSYLNISVGLITGSGCRKFPSKINPKGWTDISRTQLLKWVENGEIPILIGTHALIQKTVKFKNLAYIIIDEQHRFGTAQRQKLRRKDDIVPHLLSMTATPIPRTLALTIYGDLDLTLLDQMPAGRKPIITEIVPPTAREKTYEKIRAELAAGRQAYVICPRINEPDPDKEMALVARSVTEEAARLKREVFPRHTIGILHSKMRPDAKDKVMLEFKNGTIDILVATSVVEVGVNVPNATSIIIEGAERFGLAQLHQLRGRVLRSNHQAYCYVFTETENKNRGTGASPINTNKTGGPAKGIERLKALVTAQNGFELAEFDLAQRGSGQLYGRKQWGITDLAMEGIKNIKMVEAARREAGFTLTTSPDLSKFPLLKKRVAQSGEEIHFE